MVDIKQRNQWELGLCKVCGVASYIVSNCRLNVHYVGRDMHILGSAHSFPRGLILFSCKVINNVQTVSLYLIYLLVCISNLLIRVVIYNRWSRGNKAVSNKKDYKDQTVKSALLFFPSLLLISPSLPPSLPLSCFPLFHYIWLFPMLSMCD